MNAAATHDRLLPALERVVLVPPEARERSVPAHEAAAMLRCDVADVGALVDAGLPVVGAAGDGGPLLDFHDVVNVGLEAGAGASLGEAGARMLLRYAASPPESWTAPRRWDVGHEYRCEAACADGAWEVARPVPELLGGAVEEWSVEQGPAPAPKSGSRVAIRGRIAAAGRREEVRDARIRDAYAAALSDLRAERVRYHWLPSRLRCDPGSLARLGAGDCAASSLALAAELERAGVEVRTRTVTALAIASVDHAWTEARDSDGRWKPLDPVFAYLARRFGIGGDEFDDFCCGSASSRVLPWGRAADEPVAIHGCPLGESPLVEATAQATLVREAA